MSPDIISFGELLVEIMRKDIDVSHNEIGAIYQGPYPSGAPAIFINSAARMSKPFHLSTGFIGVIGNDEFGNSITNKLKFDGVDISQIKVNNNKTTGIAFNQYNSDGSRKFIFAPGAAGDFSIKDLKRSYFSDVKALHIMGSSLAISSSSCEACYEAISIAKSINSKVIISFDPNLRSEMLSIEKIIEICKPVLEQTDILLPSEEEALMLTQTQNYEEACHKLLEYDIPLIILKKGNNGCIIYSEKDRSSIEVPSYKVNEIDPTGAGDCFGGAFIASYIAGWDLMDVARFSNAVGALKVTHFGPMPDTTYEEVIGFMKQF